MECNAMLNEEQNDSNMTCLCLMSKADYSSAYSTNKYGG
jgi:hypothetical protein